MQVLCWKLSHRLYTLFLKISKYHYFSLFQIKKRAQLPVRVGGCNIGVGEWEIQTTGCEIGYKDILHNMGNRANIL